MFDIKLTTQELQLVINCIQEQPAKHVFQLLIKIQDQANQQLKAQKNETIQK